MTLVHVSFLATVLAQPTTSTTSSSTNIHTTTLLVLLWRLLCIDDALLDIRRQAEKGLFHVDVAFGRDFHEGDAELVGQGLALLGGDGALLFPVAFVADEDFVHAFGGVLLDVGEPCSDVCVYSYISLFLYHAVFGHATYC